jgi:hypothetical protein
MERHGLVANLADQKHRRPGCLSYGKPKLVLSQGRLNHASHFGCYSKEAVRWRHAVNALVGPEMIVMGNEVRETLARVLELLGLHALPELLAHRLPESLALTERLRMMRAGHDVPDPLAVE